MDNKENLNDSKTININLQNEKDEKDEVIISLSGIIKKLKKYLLIWIVACVVACGLIFSSSLIFAADTHKNLTALVSFTYAGIEKGLDPAGSAFDINSIKTPKVIEAALTEVGEELDNLENIRQGFSFVPVIPSDAIDRITVYKSVYENASTGALNAAQAMLDTDYFATQYKVNFNYAQSGFDASEAADFMNIMLEKYRDYFFQTYGYNNALGSAVIAIDYNDYDYAEAIDVFSNSLKTLKSYVNNLVNDDKTRFRSSRTGYTFADLSDAIGTLSSIDLDVISSYITINNVTKDKVALVDYYNFRIEQLTREKAIAEDRLKALTETIENYVKDEIFIFGNGTDDTNTHSTVASEAYDKLILDKIEAQRTLSTDTQQIEYYKQRIAALKGNVVASKDKIEKVEKDLESLNVKLNKLIDDVNETADEYYNTVSFANAYNILVPASASYVDEMGHAISDSIKNMLVICALLTVAYIGIAFVTALVDDNRKHKAALAAAAEAEKKAEKNKKN